MESGIIIDIIYNSSKQNDVAIDTCNNIIEQYPYFQMAHMLKSKILHTENKIDFAKAIKNAAIYAPDRSKLHDLIQTKNEPKHAFNKSNVEKWEIESKAIPRIKEEEQLSDVENVEVEKGDLIIEAITTDEIIDDTNIVIVDNDESLLAKLVQAEAKEPIEPAIINEESNAEDEGHHPVFEHVDALIVEDILNENETDEVDSEVEVAEAIISDRISTVENNENELSDPEAIARSEKVDEIIAHIDATLPEALDRDANEELINQRLKELFSEDELAVSENNVVQSNEEEIVVDENYFSKPPATENIPLEVAVASIDQPNVVEEFEENVTAEIVISQETEPQLSDEDFFELIAIANKESVDFDEYESDFHAVTEDEKFEIEALMSDGLVLNTNDTLPEVADGLPGENINDSDSQPEIIDDIIVAEPTDNDHVFVEEEIGLLNIELESAYFDIEKIATQADKTETSTIEEQAFETHAEQEEINLNNNVTEQHDFFDWLTVFQKKESKNNWNQEVASNEISENDDDHGLNDLPLQNEHQGTKSRFSSQNANVNKDEIIEHFIKADPRIEPLKAEFYKPSNMARKSVEWDENLVSETLADIFRQQGLNEKAIKAYEKLSLAFPEKKHFFAEIIKTIKNTD